MPYKAGIDIGSTTIKLVVVVVVSDADKDSHIRFSRYQRHFSNIQEPLLDMARAARSELGDIEFSSTITGSGGLSLAQWVGVPFVQEVVAVSKALEAFAPHTDD